MSDIGTMLSPLGWDAEWAETYAVALTGLADTGVVPGRVGRVDRSAFDVHTGFGVLRVGEAAEPVCTGDWVAVDTSGQDPRVAAVLPRRTAFSRAESSGRSVAQVLAANIDVVVVVVSLASEVDLGRLERLLALGWSSGATPVVVLSQSDLATRLSSSLEAVSAAAPGCEVLVTSAVTGQGIEAVAAVGRPHRSLVLLGVSGAGKSTLANALMGSAVQPVRAVRRVDGKGRHTTTSRELLVLPGGGALIDTPGLRGVGLFDAEDGIAMAFSDVDDFAVDCRFGDCSHTCEPGCAVVAAVDAGELEPRRVESWHKLQREVAWMARRTDVRAMAANKRKWKAIHKSVRDAGVVRP
ncbi:MAG: ribosome small subunit-dependent GTPase A [Candidatus Nanopelagicales bacterium]